MKIRWTTIVLLILFALMSTGGSFTCFYSSDSDHIHHRPPSSR